MKKGLAILFMLVCSAVIHAQTTVTGNVFDIYLESIPAIKLSSGKASAISDANGVFTLETSEKLPFNIEVSGVGYQTQVIEISDLEEVSIVLEKQSKLQEVIVSASRTPERVLESPVSVERFGTSDIKNSTGLDFYESLANLKGIDVLHNSYNIKNVVSNRGFANTENTRFVQLVDGIETTVPFINYSLGNNLGVSDLDLKNVEILPGAASALYGPNAFNGIMLMTTKSPFVDQGVSAYVKTGVTSQDATDSNGFVDFGLRYGHKFSDKFAAKINLSINTAEDWHATDRRNTSEQGGVIIGGEGHYDVLDSQDNVVSEGVLDYDGLNIYGDEIDVNVIQLALVSGDAIAKGQSLGLDALGLGALEPLITTEALVANLDNITISRIGYAESDLIDYNTNAFRFDGSIYYRPFGTEKLEIELGAKYGVGDNIIHGFNRYSQKDGSTSQFKAAITGDNFSVKGYYTKNNANLVDTRLLGIFVNNQGADERTYFGTFVGAAIGSGFFNPLSTARQNIIAGHIAAEANRLVVGTDAFNNAVSLGENTSIQEGGALITDKSSFYHIDANYNFRDLVEFMDFQLGGSFREYTLNSGGDLFSDFDDRINIKEFGFYAQGQKKFLDDHLKVSVTARYDKSENFAYKVSPRTSIAYAIGDAKNHNIRFSYQTGFRNPTNQDQYANTNLGDRRIVGSVRDNLERVAVALPANSASGREIIPGGVVIGEDQILDNSYTASSVEAFQEAAFETILSGASLSQAVQANQGLLEVSDLDYIKPETVQTFELGYRGAATISNKLFEFDIAGFYNVFENFLTHKSIVVPFYGDVKLTPGDGPFPLLGNDLPGQAILLTDAEEFIIRTNAKGKLKAYGLNVGFTTEIFNDFKLGVSYAFSKLDTDNIEDKDFNPEYNTPENVFNLSFGHDKLFANFGFQVDARFQDEYLYQSVFIQDVIAARAILDAQVHYNIPSINSRVKLGATNIGGKDYQSVAGAGSIGSQYYINWTINN